MSVPVDWKKQVQPIWKADRKPKAPKKPINQRSEKKVEGDKELDRVHPLVAKRSQGRCEIRTAGCEGKAVHVHHVRMRSQGVDHSLPNLLHVCQWCHHQAHHHPDRYVLGWLERAA